jgi:hypothetical protein
MTQNPPRIALRDSIPVLALAALALFMLAATGCGTISGSNPADFAAVTIEGHSREEIAATAIQVFTAEGYVGGRKDSGQLVFDRDASKATTVAREGVTSTFYGATVLNRVKTDIVGLGGNRFLLQCKAYVVTGGGDTFFQDETPLANIRRKPYKALLNKVKAQLESPEVKKAK